MTTPAYRTGWVALGLGMACFAAHNAPEVIAQRWFAKTPEHARSLKYTLNPQGLIVTSDVSQQFYCWLELYGFEAVPEALLVWVSPQLFLIVPKRAFRPEDLARVLEQFDEHVGAPPRLPRFWSWMLVAIALAMAGLMLWNWLDPR
jgi:hypothetical protein